MHLRTLLRQRGIRRHRNCDFVPDSMDIHNHLVRVFFDKETAKVSDHQKQDTEVRPDALPPSLPAPSARMISPPRPPIPPPTPLSLAQGCRNSGGASWRSFRPRPESALIH